MSIFTNAVTLKFRTYKNLFLTLPFEGINSTGNFLPLLEDACRKGLEKKKSPVEIVNFFFRKNFPNFNEHERINQLFRFVQYIERQVVLFDATEDAAFNEIIDPKGKGTIAGLANKIQNRAEEELIAKKIDDFSVRIVLTAHPTQFYHGHILSIIKDLGIAIKKNNVGEVNTMLKQLGLTKFYHNHKPSPLDEAVSLIWYLENVFYYAIPQVRQQLLQTFRLKSIPPKLLRLGFWPGGDRDGNPFVKAQTTLVVSSKLKDAIIRCYQAEIRGLKKKLTFLGTDVLARKIERKLSAHLYKLDEDKYQNADELIEDLFAIKNILNEKFNALYVPEINSFIAKVRTFGFFFASLDIRQDSRVHHEIVCAILHELKELDNYNNLQTDEEKFDFLFNFNKRIDAESLSDDTAKETVKYINLLLQIQKNNGEESCNRYIISNTQSAINLFELLFLFKVCGYSPEALPFDVIPLFETVSDLENAPKVMQLLYSNKFYCQYLRHRENKQTIMLGFSDGTKDGGYITANWKIYQAKQALSEVSRSNGISVVFFDGRGGPPARGGGDTHAFYASLGKSIENKEIQITIQGQTISSKFGKIEVAKYNLEQLLTAGLVNSIDSNNHRDFTNSELDVLNTLSDYSLAHYKNLKAHPQFLDYLEHVTVLNYYAQTNIGSRPAKRNNGKLSLDSLRAIPFVGAWSQMKQNIPGFYGFGHALEKYSIENDETALFELYNKSLFFKALVLNSMQSLAKTNFELTRYLEKNETYGAFWKILENEFNLSTKWLLKLANYHELLQEDRNNMKSIMLREKLVLPLLIIQQYALLKIQDCEDETLKEKFKKLIVRCFFGNINATRNAA